MPFRINILGVGVHAINMKEAVGLVDQAIAKGQKGYICVTGVHGIMEAQHDIGLKKTFNSSFLTVPDGMPTVWIGKSQGHETMGRVYGPDLMIEVCKMSVKKGYTHFLFGGNPGVAEELKASLEQKVPGVKIVGTYTPPFRPLNVEEEKDLKSKVSTLKPDIMWIGISTPKQDRFMGEYIHKLDTKLMFGVGAAFDFHTGKIKDSPDWVKNAGLQWAHRLCQEPKRLWRRYLLNNPKFMAKVAAQMVGIKKYSL